MVLNEPNTPLILCQQEGKRIQQAIVSKESLEV